MKGRRVYITAKKKKKKNSSKLDLANGSGRVGLGHGSKWGQLQKGCLGSGRNGFGSEWVWVEKVPGQNGFLGRVGSVWLKKWFFLKERLYIKGKFCRVEMGPGVFLNSSLSFHHDLFK
ncbi:hypothetical protein HanRHA438_Chr03g0102901 [Helianthus annuus]|nr:hypothetical protein HanRHA438_Chr03g0102901 [Helianthus annuus]